MTDYQHLRELAEQATPGPWKHENGQIDGPNYAEVITAGRVECMAYCYGGSSTIEWEREADADFVAAANPETVLALLDEIEQLRRGQGRAPAPLDAGPAPVALHEAHPIPDSTRSEP